MFVPNILKISIHEFNSTSLEMEKLSRRFFIIISFFCGVYTSSERNYNHNYIMDQPAQPICNDSCTQLVENAPAVYLSIFSTVRIRSMELHEVLVFSEYNGSYKFGNNIPDFTFYIDCGYQVFVSEPLKLKIGTVQNITIPVGALPGSHEPCYLKFNSSFHSPSGEYGPEFSRIQQSQNKPVKATTKILIQTDKPVYKPKDVVRFRVLVLNNKLKVLPQSNITVEISDSEKNTIKRWKNIPVTNGIFSSNLTLSEEPNLGEWKLKVTAQGKTKTAHFKIDKYTLPKFRVNLNHASYVTNEESNVTVEIRAFYTYGKGVDGNATISLRKLRVFKWNSWRQRVREWITDIIKSVEIVNGIGTVDFDFKETNITAGHSMEEFAFSVNVTENVTNITHSDESMINLFREKYKLNLQSESTQIPWMPITVKFTIMTRDDKPVYDPRPDAVVIIAENDQLPKYERPLSTNGTIRVKYNVTKDMKSLSLKVHYKNQQFDINIKTPIGYSDTQSGIEMKLSSLAKFVNPGENVEIQIRTNSQMQNISLNYFLRRGKLFLHQGMTTLRNNDPSSRMLIYLNIPESDFEDDQIELCAFFFEETPYGKELIFYHMNLYITQNSCAQTLELQKSQMEYKPGEEIVLHFLTNTSTTPTIMAIRAVDESILLLSNKDNDITQKSLEGDSCSGKSFSKNKKSNSANTFHNPIHHIKSCDLVFLTYSFNIEEELSSSGNPSDSTPPNLCPMCPKKVRFINSYMHARSQGTPRRYGGGAIKTSGTSIINNRLSSSPRIWKPPVETIVPLKPRVRKHFPETWIWTEIQTVVNNSLTTFKTTLPDTMTSWAITAFALNSDAGLSVMESPQTVTTFQPFFTSLNLPYSVIKEKAFSLQVLVHNYLNVDILANVTLDNKKREYQFIDQHQDQLSKTLTVSANKVAAINFVIVPKIFGNITLNVNTTSNSDSMTSFSDALSRQLLVIPDGVKKIETKNILVNLRNNENMSEDIAISFPTRRVRGADRIKINVVGDLMGISAENLDNLIHLPTGCGEQNMLKFVPDVVILRYLKARGMLTTHMENKLLKYLEIGYMQQLKFRHPDGSFSAFGFHSDRIGSTWLTAFVLKSFAWARDFINIDDKIFEKGLKFLVSTQNSETGEFIETGRIFQLSIQGGSGSKGVPITAYVSVALQQVLQSNNLKNSTLTSAIQKSLDFISSSNKTDDQFSVILSAYALQNANHKSSDIFYELMNKLSIQSPGLLYWQKSDDLTTNYATPLSIEMTSYALLTYLSRNQFSDGFPIFKWLMLQRNSNGGFKSTQDTVVGLMALAKYAEKTFSPFGTNLTVSIKTDGHLKSFSIDEDNQGLHEIILADVNSTKINVMASGNGTALVQVSSSYYVGGDDYDHSTDGNINMQPFIIKAKVKTDDKGESVLLTVSTKATYTAKTSMAVIEIKLPPTYTIFDENVEEVKKAENVKMVEVETRKGNVKLIVYYDSLGSEASSFTVLLSRSHSIADVRTLSITAYEYNGDKKSVVFEKVPYKTICDLCIENNACNIEKCA